MARKTPTWDYFVIFDTTIKHAANQQSFKCHRNNPIKVIKLTIYPWRIGIHAYIR